MDKENSFLSGSVEIIHHLQDGKHTYEVGQVDCKKTGKGNPFVRGEKLMQINRMDVQNIGPEELAQAIADGNSMLTVHGSTADAHIKQNGPCEDTLHIDFEKNMLLDFSMDMVMEGHEEGGVSGIKGETCLTDVEEMDALIVSMMKTNFVMLRGRGDNQEFCSDCSDVRCHVNDVVMKAERSTVTTVSRGSASFRLEKQSDVFVEHPGTQEYLRNRCSRQLTYFSPEPKMMTIYYYKSSSLNKPFRGLPVVLNFTDSNHCLKCSKQGETVRLQAEPLEKNKVMDISMNDELGMSYVFYMKSTGSPVHTFESALFPGWFIRRHSEDTVDVGRPDCLQEELLFRVIIQK